MNRQQTLAVTHGQGPCMVIASAGTGKTTVITHRLRYLTTKCHINPSNILVITFTKAAAMEMKERYLRLRDAEGAASPSGVTSGAASPRVTPGAAPPPAGTLGAASPSFGTFHAVFFQILKVSYRYDAGSIAREEQQLQFLRELVQREDLELEDEKEFLSSVLGEISSVKGEMMNLEHYYSKNCSEEIFKRLYAGYERKMRQAGLIDFDDMLVLCYELLRDRADIRAAWQNKYRYILIDEFQDINRLQYEIVRMLAEPERNLFIVGDDDQSIYRFRGAKPEIMLGFERDYPGTRRILLDVNYRSTEEILRPALRLIGRNEKRFKKEIRTAGARGHGIITKIWQDEKEETEHIAAEIRDYVGAGYGYGDIAVLYRTNSGPRLLIEKLMEYNLPFKTRDTVPNLYEHWIAKDILTYIRIAMGSRERSDFLRIINRPKRYVSRDAMNAPEVSFRALKAFYGDKDWMEDRIESLEYDLKAISRMSPLAAVNYIRQGIGYDAYLSEYAAFRRMKPEELCETADQLRESAAGYKTFAEWFAHIDEYTEELKQQAKLRETQTDAVTLVTMHGAKGLEFPVVYILDANEGVTPHRKSVLDADIEEERRLFFVAMTRAKERLHVYAVRERHRKAEELSRFVGEYLTENAENGGASSRESREESKKNGLRAYLLR